MASTPFKDRSAVSLNCEYLTRYASRTPRATALDYLNKVKALYDKRNECIHALGIELSDHEASLYKRKKDEGKAVVNAQNLMDPCEECLYDSDISLARAIDAVSLELAMASLALTLLPISVQWFRLRGTAFDFAPLVDHYVALSLQPLDQQLGLLRELEATIQAKLDAYHAANPTATS